MLRSKVHAELTKAMVTVKHSSIFLFLCLLPLFYGCSKDEPHIDTSLNYFPLSVGSYWIYDVTEITFDTLTQNKTIAYQEKYEIIDSYKNLLDENTFVIYVSTRDNDTESWTDTKTWSVKMSQLNEVIESEENIAYIKLLIPIRDGLKWKGNKYNTIEADRNNSTIDEFQIIDFKKPFESTNSITVQESNEVNFTYKDIRYSTYAESIGLVKRVNNYVEYCTDKFCWGLYIRAHERTKIQTLIDHVVQ